MKKYKTVEALDTFGPGAEVVPAAEAGPDPVYVRIFHGTVNRHRDLSRQKAAELADETERLYRSIRAGRDCSPSDARSIVMHAADLARHLDALEALREVEGITTTPED